ncbi:MAG: S41 family peptidase [Roseiflexaceae bacterium]
MDIFPSLILSLSASVVLIALDLFIVLRYTVLAKRALPRWVDFLPAQSPYQGRVAVLIDNYSHSSAEDTALFLKGLPNGMAVGMSGTAGGGGVSETDVHLPGDYTFAFPKAQSLDSNFKIQIESDDTGNGGVTPNVWVPLDDAAVDALGAGRDIVLEHAVAALREQAAAR